MKKSYQPTTLVDLLCRRAIEQPDRLAYTFLADGVGDEPRLTYSELDRRARSIAVLLQSLGVSGERVLLLYPPGLEYIAAFFGCLYAGAIAVPLYPPRHNRTMARILNVIKDAQPAIALTTSQILLRASRLTASSGGLISMRWLTFDDEAIGAEDEWREPHLEGDSLAFLQYTSGSTGEPKGVMLSHQNLIHNSDLLSRFLESTPESYFVSWLPLYHDMGLIAGILQPLYVGFPCAFMSPASFLQRPARWLEAISRYKATISGGPNFSYDLCVRKVSPEQKSTLDLSSWTSAFNGAEPIRAETLIRFAETFEPCGFRKQAFFACYGLAELTLVVSGGKNSDLPVIKYFQLQEIEKNRAVESVSQEGDTRRLVGCGRTLPGVRVIIVNPETLIECPPGEIGEVWVSGGSVAGGYWDLPAETARAFRAFTSDGLEGPFLRTGDLGLLLDGELFITGRLKDLIIIRGLNHYPQDIELTVERSHPSLRPGCGAAFSVEIGGEERLAVAQEIDRAREDVGVIIEQIRRRVADEHELQVFAVAILRAGSLPKTSSGKVQRQTCRSAFLDGTLELIASWQESGSSERDPVADPAHSFETRETILDWLTSRIAARAGVGQSEIDVDQPIDHYGMDSLMATELAHSIEINLGEAVPMAGLLADLLGGLSISRLVDRALENRPEKMNGWLRAETAEDPRPQPGDDLHPLSHGQKALLFLHRLASESANYNLAGAARINADLDVEALRRSFEVLVERHTGLRTTFITRDGESFQRIHNRVELSFQCEDASSWGHAQIDGQLTAHAQRPFDLEKGPLLRVVVFRRSPMEHVMLLAMHHIISDFWSFAVLLKELGEIYSAERRGSRPELRPLALNYADFVRRQSKMLAGPEGEKSWFYWKNQLAGELPVMDLLTDRPRPPAQSYSGASHPFRLEMQLAQDLKRLGRSRGATLFMTLLAGFQSLLHRYTGQEDLLVGSPTSGRDYAELTGLIGYFVNPVMIRADFSGVPTFAVFLERVRRAVLGAFEHQRYPFPLLVERLQPERDPSRSPISQVMFTFHKSHLPDGDGLASFAIGANGARVAFGELPMESVRVEQPVAQFDLTLAMAESGDGLSASLQYNKDLFDSATIIRLAGHFQTLLKSIVAVPDRPISTLAMLTDAESHSLLIEWNSARADYSKESLVHELFEDQVEKNPHAIALVYEEQSLTYGALNERTNRLAHHLQKLGVGSESRVAICLDRGLEMVVALLATLKAGAAYVPLDPDYPSERLAYMLDDSAPVVLLTHGAARSTLAARLPAVPMLDLESDEAQWIGQSDQNLGLSAAGSDARSLAYIIYTSGSTGAPKGVMVGHANVVRLMESTGRWFGFGPADVWTLFHSYAFDFSVWEMWGALAYGGRLIIVPQSVTRSPEEFYDLLCRAGVTVLNQTPSAFRQLMPVEKAKAERHELRCVIFGGEALDAAMLKPWYERNDDKTTQMVNMYGITETTVHVAYRLLEESDTRRMGASPIGRRIPDLKTYILEAHGQPVPIGLIGELHIGGAGVARGYLNRPELTGERFQPDGNGPEAGARIYKTGDLGRWLADGEMEFLGRNDSQVKIRGFRIELGEIETRLSSHPSIREAVVVAREGVDGDKKLVAYYTGEDVGAGELRAHLASALPDYMAPAAYAHLERLPLTPNGKLDRRALPVPEGESYVKRGYETPIGETERKLARIWAEALNLDRVGRNDNFFELGGHSLLAVRLIERMRQEGVSADVRAFYTNPILSSFALAVGGESGLVEIPPNRIPAECEAITPEMLPLVELSAEEIEIIVGKTPGGAANVQDIYPLAPLQEGMLFHYLMSAEGDAYLLSALLAFDTRGRMESFVDALQAVIDRHDILRTAVVWEGLSEPVQVVWREAPLSVEEVQLNPGGGDIARQLLKRFDPRRYRMSLGQAPLMRMIIAYDAAAIRWTGLLLYHHLVDDNTSVRLIIAEVRAHLEGRVEQLAEPLPFRNFVAQARLGVSREEHERFFREMLGDVDEPTAPYGLIDAQGDGSGVREERRAVDAVLTGRLRQTSRALGVSAASLCHLAWALALGRVSGRDDVVFGTILFGRLQGIEGADRALGMLINTLPVRIRVCEKSVEESVRQTHQSLTKLMRHEHAPLALAQRCSGVGAPAPLFSALFNYRHNSREAEAGAGPGVSWQGIEILASEERSNYPLVLSVDDLGDDLALTAETVEGIDPWRICDYMLTAMEGLVEVLEWAPETAISEIEVLPEAERRQVVEEWNATEARYPREKLAHQLFEEQADRAPDRVAGVNGDVAISYGELNRRANQLGNCLRRHGVGVESRVGICLGRGVEMLVGLLGIMKAGASYAPLDPAYPAERLSFMLEDSSVRLIVTQEKMERLLGETTAELIRIDSDCDEIGREDDKVIESGVESENLAYVIYTSGSTGRPKGAMITH